MYIEEIIWPAQYGIYKVCQFTDGTISYLRFSPRTDFHKDIVRSFANEAHVGYKLILGPDHNHIPQFPDDSLMKLVGAGYCNFDLEDKTLSFGGNSHDYKIGINAKHLADLQKQFPEWKFNYSRLI